MSHEVQIEASWKQALEKTFEQTYFQELRSFLRQEKQAGKTIFPPGPLIFKAFDEVPLHQVKAVILGQDPYHAPNQAMGLSFSVPKGVRVPPSLQRIYQELERDVPDFKAPKHGDLSPWAKQGVFLLNAVLTVEQGKPNSHKKSGWERFTDEVIATLSQQTQGLVFLLWGKHAQAKSPLIDTQKHLILQAAHPSPLAGNAFSGCQHFSQTNAYLQSQGKTPINWQLD